MWTKEWMGVKINAGGSCPSVRGVYLPCMRSAQKIVRREEDVPERGRMRTEGFTERSASDWVLQMPFDHICAGGAMS